MLSFNVKGTSKFAIPPPQSIDIGFVERPVLVKQIPAKMLTAEAESIWDGSDPEFVGFPEKRRVRITFPVPSWLTAYPSGTWVSVELALKLPGEEVKEQQLLPPDQWTADVDVSDVLLAATPLVFRYLPGTSSIPHIFSVIVAGKLKSAIKQTSGVRLQLTFRSTEQAEPGALSVFTDVIWQAAQYTARTAFQECHLRPEFKHEPEILEVQGDDSFVMI